MKTTTATECWTILKSELDIDMKNQGKRSNKKHLSKEAFRKIRYKQAINKELNVQFSSVFMREDTITRAYFIFVIPQWFIGRGNRHNFEICR